MSTRQQVEGLKRPLIAVVGPCASGKSALVNELRRRGYNAREVAQEHSGVPDLWRRFYSPDRLIFLDVTLATALRRRPLLQMNSAAWAEQTRRLECARRHAHLIIGTDALSLDEVVEQVLVHLSQLS